MSILGFFTIHYALTVQTEIRRISFLLINNQVLQVGPFHFSAGDCLKYLLRKKKKKKKKKKEQVGENSLGMMELKFLYYDILFYLNYCFVISYIQCLYSTLNSL